MLIGEGFDFLCPVVDADNVDVLIFRVSVRARIDDKNS